MERDWLSASAARTPDRPFLVTPGGTITFGDMDLAVRRATGALREAGVGPGARVAVWARNEPDAVVALFAVPRTGAAAVPVNTRLSEREVADVLRVAGARLAVGPVPGAVERVARLDGDPVDGLPPDPDRDHSIVFTSGSRGTARGVRLTWRNLEASAAASAAHLRHTAADRWLCVLPVYHVGGLSILVRSARQGGSVALEPSFSAERAAGMLRDGQVTLASLVAVMLRRILETHPGPYRGVRAVLVGGGSAPRDLLEQAAEAGLPVLATYGMTETAAQIATAPLEDGLHPRDSVAPLPGVELRIGDGGRIEVRGEMVSPGAVDDPGRAPDEWYVTGDVGELDDRGLLVLGRADDVILTGGENVHPLEVEAVLGEHPEVEDVVVVGVPDPTWGEMVCAVWEGTAAPGDLERRARLRLAGYKIPKRWLRVDRLPRLGIGKPDRAAVRRLLT